jgi:hypothetical protein
MDRINPSPLAALTGTPKASPTWNEVVVPVGTSGVGKQIETVTIGYDQPLNTGGYRGFIDDVRISE